LKVLFITNIPSPYRVDFFNELGKQCELTVLFERSTATDRDVNWLSKHKVFFRVEYLHGVKFRTDSALCLEVTKWLNKGMFDIFIVGGYGSPTAMIAIETLAQRKIPFILNADGGFIRDDSKLKFLLKRHFINKAKHYLSSGRATSTFFEHFGVVSDVIHEYPFTSLQRDDILDKVLTHRDKDNYKKKLNIVEKKVILSVGQFIYRKGFDVLLEACTMVSKEFGVYIVGGQPIAEYIAIKEKYKLKNVHFVGFKNKEELKKYYMASDLFVLPTREDIWGLVINEAMAYGLPVITTNRCIAGLELVDNDNGRIVLMDDALKLAEGINELLDNDQMLKLMSENSLKKIRPYTIENMAKVHMNIFKNII